MKLLVSTPIRFQTTLDGALWVKQKSDSYQFWTRYLTEFDSVTILGRVHAVATAPSGWLRADGPGVSLAPVPDFVGPYQLMRKWFSVSRAIRAGVSTADAVLLRAPCNLATLLWRSLARGRPYGVEVVGDPYGTLAPGAVKDFLRPVWRWLLPYYLQRICNGATAAAYVTRDALQRLYPPRNDMFSTSYSDVVTTHYSSINLQPQGVIDTPRTYAANQETKVVICVGAMDVLYKAQDILIKACALCVHRGVDLHLVLIGDGKMRNDLETLVEKTGMSRLTSFAGQLSGTDQITQALDCADLFVLPSRTEGLPRAMIEAMARGLPCIGSDVGGIPELISADCLVPPEDAPALAAKICEVLADRPRMARMSKENIHRVADYSEDVLRGRREAFYRHLALESAKWQGAGLPPARPKGSDANASQQDGYSANTFAEPTRRPLVVFGVNSTFALNHLLAPTLIGLVQKGFRIAAIAPNAETGFLHGAACRGILLRNVDIRREISLFADLKALFTLVMLFARLRPAIVNLSTPKMAFLGGMAAFLTRVPRRIYFLRGLRYETVNGRKRRLLIACEWVACACAHEVICVSPSVRQCAVEAGIVPESKTVMLGTRASDGINLRRFDAGAGSAEESGMLLRHTLGLSDQSFVIGYVGRLTHDKGVEELVQASMDLAHEGRDIRLLMIGGFESGDPVDSECARLISTNALIHATGYIDDPAPYYRAMDLFAFPSHREGLGNVLLEAAAAGRPTVATRVTGCVDAIEDGVTGVLVPAHDSNALKIAIADLMDNAAKRQSMSTAAQIFVREYFDAAKMLDALAAFMAS